MKESPEPSVRRGGDPSWFWRSLRPFQKATVRGLAVVLPPLLTIVLFIWAWNTVDRFILAPIESLARKIIVWNVQEIVPDEEIQRQLRNGSANFIKVSNESPPTVVASNGRRYVSIKKSWIPWEVYEIVDLDAGAMRAVSAQEYYRDYVSLRYLQRQYVIPAFLALFVGLLYLFGKIFAVGLGRLLWNYLEGLVNRLPIIRNVYSSVKQVTDFAFNESEIKFTRVVAVEYPRRGIWSMGFVTGEGMATIAEAAGEPMVNVLMPTSPMPATGFTITVPKSHTIDLNISVDQAIQYCVSCGVVIPPHQQSRQRGVVIPPLGIAHSSSADGAPMGES
ncbi:MAG TPA: DUF502 domain-containing protein [Pirellulaceae bacterium]|nr:DUF502 domain-containing protein [Pirellulaceae bacterium]